MEHVVDDLLNRIASLERGRRCTKGIAGGTLLVFAALIAMGQATAERGVEIAASSFRLLDEQGATLAAFRKGPDGVALFFYDKAGTKRTALGLVRDQPFLDLFDSGGESAVTVVVTSKGPEISLSAKQGKSKAQLVLGNGGPGLALTDGDGVRRLALFLGDDGPLLGLVDGQGVPRIGISLSGDRPAFHLNDRTGTLRAVMGAAEVKTGGAGDVLSSAESSLMFMDEDGKVIYRAGK
jgi:hypothetical protein